DDWFAWRDLYALRLADLRADPAYAPWSLRAICLGRERRAIGHIGFHTRPDPDYLRPQIAGAVEFGYGVFPRFRGRGYAQEAARGLMDWAERVHGVRRFVLSVAPGNAPSVAITRRLGFHRVAGHPAPGSGWEDIYLREFGEPASTASRSPVEPAA